VAGFFLYLVRVGLPASVLTALAVPWLYRAALEAHRNRHRWRRSFFRRLRGYERKILVQR
jgi:hypothetical protein